MNNRYLFIAIMLAPFSVTAGEMGTGHGTDGPNAAPTIPDETESSSDSYWQELVEWFEVDGDDE